MNTYLLQVALWKAKSDKYKHYTELQASLPKPQMRCVYKENNVIIFTMEDKAGSISSTFKQICEAEIANIMNSFNHICFSLYRQ